MKLKFVTAMVLAASFSSASAFAHDICGVINVVNCDVDVCGSNQIEVSLLTFVRGRASRFPVNSGGVRMDVTALKLAGGEERVGNVACFEPSKRNSDGIGGVEFSVLKFQ